MFLVSTEFWTIVKCIGLKIKLKLIFCKTKLFPHVMCTMSFQPNRPISLALSFKWDDNEINSSVAVITTFAQSFMIIISNLNSKIEV